MIDVNDNAAEEARVVRNLKQAGNSHDLVEMITAVDLIPTEDLAMIQDMALIAGDEPLLFVVEGELRRRDYWIGASEVVPHG